METSPHNCRLGNLCVSFFASDFIHALTLINPGISLIHRARSPPPPSLCLIYTCMSITRCIDTWNLNSDTWFPGNSYTLICVYLSWLLDMMVAHKAMRSSQVKNMQLYRFKALVYIDITSKSVIKCSFFQGGRLHVRIVLWETILLSNHDINVMDDKWVGVKFISFTNCPCKCSKKCFDSRLNHVANIRWWLRTFCARIRKITVYAMLLIINIWAEIRQMPIDSEYNICFMPIENVSSHLGWISFYLRPRGPSFM